jgi:hypothetical protein
VQPTATPQGAPPQSADVLAPVSAGAKYTLGGFSIKGAQDLSQDEIIQQFTFHPGDMFNATAIGEGLIRLKKLYEARGYVHFEVIPQLQTDEVRHATTLILNIKEGGQQRPKHTQSKTAFADTAIGMETYHGDSAQIRVDPKEPFRTEAPASLPIPSQKSSSGRLTANQEVAPNRGHFRIATTHPER